MQRNGQNSGSRSQKKPEGRTVTHELPNQLLTTQKLVMLWILQFLFHHHPLKLPRADGGFINQVNEGKGSVRAQSIKYVAFHEFLGFLENSMCVIDTEETFRA